MKTLLLLLLFSISIFAATCNDVQCDIGNYSIKADKIITENPDADNHSYWGEGTFSISGNSQSITFSKSRFDLFESFTCKDDNCSEFTPSQEAIYLSQSSNSDAKHINLHTPKHTIAASSLEVDLSSEEQIVLGLSGTTTIEQENSPEFTVQGNLELGVNGDTLTPREFGIAFESSDGQYSTPDLSSCQELNSDALLSFGLGNIRVGAKKICIEDSKFRLYQNANSTVYLHASKRIENSYMMKLPSAYSEFDVDLNALSSTIKLDDNDVSLRDGVVFSADALCLNQKLDGSENDPYVIAGSCSGFDTKLGIGGLELNHANAKIQMHDGRIENINFAQASVPNDVLPENAKRSRWYGEFMDNTFYLLSNSKTIYSERSDNNITFNYGYMVDTSEKKPLYYYRTLKSIMITADKESSFENNVFTKPVALHAMQKRYIIDRSSTNKFKLNNHTDENLTVDVPFVFHNELNSSYPTMQVDDSKGNYLSNYEKAVNSLGKAYYDISSSGALFMEGNWSSAKSSSDALTFLHASLDIKDIASLKINDLGGIDTKLGSFKTENFSITAKASSISFDEDGNLVLPDNFTLKHLSSGNSLLVNIIGDKARLRVNSSNQTITANAVKINRDGTVLIDTNATINFSDNSTVKTTSLMRLNMASKIVSIIPDNKGVVSFDNTVITLEKPLEVMQDDLSEGKFTGALMLGDDNHRDFHFKGEGTYSIEQKTIASITQINTHKLDDPRYSISTYSPTVFLGSLGIWSEGMKKDGFHFDSSGISVTNASDFHFARNTKTGQFVDFKINDVNITIDPINNKISAISAVEDCHRGECTKTTPTLTYVNDAGITYTMDTSDIFLNKKENAVDTIELLAPVTIQSSNAQSYSIDGNVSIDYMNRRIIRIAPKPGTGLVLNEETAIYSDNDDFEIDDNGVLHVSGNIDIGRAAIANNCSSENNCITYNGEFTYNTYTHKFIAMTSSDGVFNIPTSDGSMQLHASSLNAIDGSTYFKVEDSTIKVNDIDVKGIVVDIGDKKIIASKINENFVWITDNGSFDINNGDLVSEGKIAISAEDVVPNVLDSNNIDDKTLRAESSFEDIIAEANISSNNESIEVTATEVIYGHYKISIKDGGQFSVKFAKDGHGYIEVKKPYITVIIDEDSEYDHLSGKLEHYEKAKPLLHYEDSIYIGKRKNLIESKPYSQTNENNESVAHFLYLQDINRFPGEYQDLKLSKLYFEIKSDENRIKFEKTDQAYGDNFLPQLGAKTLYMMFATEGDNTYVDLYKDRVEIESKVAFVGADFIGLIVPGKSASVWDLLGILPFFDVHNDPRVTLSQKEGKSKSQLHYGITNPLKIFDEDAEFGTTWTTFIKGVHQTDDLVALDLDFVSETYGGSFQVPMDLLGKMFKGGVAPGSSMDSVFLGMWFQPYIKDTQKHIMLDKISMTLVKTDPPLFNVPPEPAGIAMERVIGSVSGFSSILSDEDGTFKVAATVKGPLTDGADILEKIGNALGMPFLLLSGGGSLEFNKKYWKQIIFSEGVMLRSYKVGEFKITLTEAKKPALEVEFLTYYGGIVKLTADAEAKIDNGFLFDIAGKADVEVPPYFPIIGGFEFTGVQAYTNWIIDRDMSGKIDKAIVGMVLEAAITKHWKVSFDFGLELQPHLKAYANKRGAQKSVKPTLYLGETEEVSLPKTRSSSLHVNLNRSGETVFIKVSGEDKAPEFDVIFPNGEHFSQSNNSDLNSSSPNLERLFFDSRENETYLALHNPELGNYTLEMKNASSAGALHVQTIYAPKKIQATLTLEPSSLRSSLRHVSLDLQGISENAEVTLYATHKKLFNLGHRITKTLSVTEGISNFDIQKVHEVLHSGYYHVYAKIELPNRVPRFFWLDEMMDFEHELSPDIAKNLQVNMNGAEVSVSWEQDKNDIKHHWLHIYKVGETHELHSHFYDSEKENFHLYGLEKDTEYEVQVESVNSNGYVSYSKPKYFKTSSHPDFKGAPDLHIDKEATKANIEKNNFSVVVCNKGSADLDKAVIDIYYKEALPQTLEDDISIENIAKDSCQEIPFSLHQSVIDYVMEHYPHEKESLLFMLEKSFPKEYQNDNDNAYISFEKSVIPETIKKVMTLKKGWNFVSLPLHVSNFQTYKLDGVDRIYTYDKHQGWIRNPEKLQIAKGYWIKSLYESSIEIEGHPYKADYSKKTPGWHLLGAGEDINNPIENSQLNMIWLYRNGAWLKNPKIIHAGEAYWAEVR